MFGRGLPDTQTDCCNELAEGHCSRLESRHFLLKAAERLNAKPSASRTLRRHLRAGHQPAPVRPAVEVAVIQLQQPVARHRETRPLTHFCGTNRVLGGVIQTSAPTSGQGGKLQPRTSAPTR